VWGQALTAVGVSTESEFRAPNRVYYPPALCLAPSLSQPSVDPSSAPTSSLAQPATTLFATPAKEKVKEHPAPVNVMEVETEEAAEVA